MKKWEYTHFGDAASDRPGMVDHWERMAEKGWELVTVDNGVAYFKREKIIHPLDMEINEQTPDLAPPEEPMNKRKWFR